MRVAALLASASAAALCSIAPARVLAWSHGNSSFNPICPFNGGVNDDGACQLLYASGRLGVASVSILHGVNLTTYAKQSGQGAYFSAAGSTYAPGTSVSHPETFNVAGDDYPIGPWTPLVSLVNAGSGVTIPGCNAYSTTNHSYTCPLPGVTVTGYVSGGIFYRTGGAVPLSDGAGYIYSGVYGSTYAPYRIIGLQAANQYILAAAPDLVTGSYTGGAWVPQTTAPNSGSVGSPQTFYTSVKTTITGYNFDDIVVNFSGVGYADVENNRFTLGAYQCSADNGLGSVNVNTNNINILEKIYSNLAQFDANCSGSAFRYPGAGGGATQHTFTATIDSDGVTMHTSGDTPVFGSYIDWNGTVPGDTAIPSATHAVQIGANLGGGVFILSHVMTPGTYTLSSGPVLARLGAFIGGAAGAGMVDVQFNYIDQMSALIINTNVGSDYIAHNLADQVGIPATHQNLVYHGVSPPSSTPTSNYGVSFTAHNDGLGTPTTLIVDSAYTGYIGNTPQVGWLVSTVNGDEDGTFHTATIQSISGSTITLDTTESSQPSSSAITFYAEPLYTVNYEVHSYNVVIANALSVGQYAYGWTTTGHSGYGPYYNGSPSPGILTYGSGTSQSTFVTVYGDGDSAPANGSTYGYHGFTLYDEVKGNVFITNKIVDTTTGSGPHSLQSGLVRYLSQGHGFPGKSGPAPGSVGAAVESGNYMDPSGSLACTQLDEPGVNSSPFSGAHLSPVYSGNIDMYDGSDGSVATCAGRGPL